jgi:hypothetical protein
MSTKTQAKMYRLAVDIWRRSVEDVEIDEFTHAVKGHPGYTKVASAVPCHATFGKGASVPNAGAGRTDYDIMVTSDDFHFPVDTDLQDGDVFKLVTEGHPRYGDFWMTQGEPQAVGRERHANAAKKIMSAARMQKPPQGVS